MFRNFILINRGMPTLKKPGIFSILFNFCQFLGGYIYTPMKKLEKIQKCIINSYNK